MLAAIGEVLPMTVAVATSPIQIIAVLVLLFSARGRVSGPAFLVGWIVGLTAVGALTLLLADPARVKSSSEPSTVGSLLQIGLGILLLVLAVRQWTSRPRDGPPGQSPTWMAGLDSASPVKAALIGAALSGINPKIIVFTIAATLSIAQTGTTVGSAIVGLAVFIVLASLTVIVPVFWYLLAPASAARVLGGWHSWLVANTAVVMTLLFLFFGVNLIGKGISGLGA
ncbi:MAG: GAP family protein [Thermomicrobiales bacterium]|nr:GAP family protein [Thermomicrobiales bacterium]